MRDFHFSSVVSFKYLYKFLAMQESLEKHCGNYHLFTLCSDSTAYRILTKLPLKNITLLSISHLESDELSQAKQNRSYHEYCWTLKPYFLEYIMDAFKDTRYFAHLDADLYFYSEPEQIIAEAPSASLFLTDHNNSDNFLHSYETSGRFNTGFVCCKNDAEAYSAVLWWKKRCLERCPIVANVAEGVYGDQKYVEKWPLLFNNVHKVRTKGANVAQWNIQGFRVTCREGKVYVNDDRLIFYHFSGLSILSRNEYNLSTFFRVEENAKQLIYIPYILNLAKQVDFVANSVPDFQEGFADRKLTSNVHKEIITDYMGSAKIGNCTFL